MGGASAAPPMERLDDLIGYTEHGRTCGATDATCECGLAEAIAALRAVLVPAPQPLVVSDPAGVAMARRFLADEAADEGRAQSDCYFCDEPGCYTDRHRAEKRGAIADDEPPDMPPVVRHRDIKPENTLDLRAIAAEPAVPLTADGPLGWLIEPTAEDVERVARYLFETVHGQTRLGWKRMWQMVGRAAIAIGADPQRITRPTSGPEGREMSKIPDRITLTKEQAEAAYDAAVEVTKEPYKHGYMAHAVFLHENGSHYMLSVRGDYENGVDFWGDETVERVVQETVTVTQWKGFV